MGTALFNHGWPRRVSAIWHYQLLSTTFKISCAMLKSWEWPRDKATIYTNFGLYWNHRLFETVDVYQYGNGLNSMKLLVRTVIMQTSTMKRGVGSVQTLLLGWTTSQESWYIHRVSWQPVHVTPLLSSERWPLAVFTIVYLNLRTFSEQIPIIWSIEALMLLVTPPEL